MTDKTTAALKLAEEFIDCYVWEYRDKAEAVLAAVREARAEQEKQDPVAYRVWDRMGGISYRRTKPSKTEYVEWDELYTAPVSAPKQDKFKEAYDVWQDKTEWVQETAQPRELGLHRADVLKMRIESIRAEALEDAAKWLAESGLIGSNDCAAAIRARGRK